LPHVYARRRPNSIECGFLVPIEGARPVGPVRGTWESSEPWHGWWGEDPPFQADDERAVYAVARELGQSGRLDQETYDAAHRFLGDAGMVELVSLCGYYTLISFLLNAFTVPLPPGTTPMWAGS